MQGELIAALPLCRVHGLVGVEEQLIRTFVVVEKCNTETGSNSKRPSLHLDRLCEGIGYLLGHRVGVGNHVSPFEHNQDDSAGLLSWMRNQYADVV